LKDITEKQITARTAHATGSVRVSPTTLQRIREGNLPKGEPFGFARAAGFLAAKRTDDLLPHCHPIPLEALTIDFVCSDESSSIRIDARAKTHARTGLEMEVLTAVSVAALTLYDLLKPVDSSLVIEGIRLLEKTGGKSGNWQSPV